MNGPYNVLLRSPEMGDLAQLFGAYTRYHFPGSNKLKEIAILVTARYGLYSMNGIRTTSTP
jgi:hypothetical protein